MSGTEKNLKKDFSLGQYYSQLQKYQTSSNNKYKTLKKDSSSSSFVKEVTKSVYPSPIYKDVNRTDKPKITIADKYSQPTKLSFDKYDSSKLQNFKKSTKGQEKKYSNYLGESLNNSNISSKKWLTDTNHEEKENIVFGSKEEKTFVQHCTQLYDIKDQSAVVDQIAKAINKRDEVYQQVSQHFKQTDQSKYGQVLQNYFCQHQLLKKIVSEFKAMSRLDIEDLGQLYYFLKTDR